MVATNLSHELCQDLYLLSRFEAIASTLSHQGLFRWPFEDHKVLLIFLKDQCASTDVLEVVRLCEGWLREATPGYAYAHDPDSHEYTQAILSASFQVQTFAYE